MTDDLGFHAFLPPLTADELMLAATVADAAASGAMPMDSEKVMGQGIYIDGYGRFRLPDTPETRAFRAIYDAFPGDLEKAKSAVMRVVVLTPMSESRKFRKWWRTDGEVREIHDALLSAMAALPLRPSDTVSGRALKRTEARLLRFAVALEAALP